MKRSNPTAYTLSQKIVSLFNRCFGGFFAVLCVLILTAGFVIYAVNDEIKKVKDKLTVGDMILRYLVLLLGAVIVCAAMVALYRFLRSDRFARLDDKRFATTVILVGVGIILAIQLVCAFLLQMEPKTDVMQVETYARHIAAEGSFSFVTSDFDNYYIIRYQNNVPYMLILSLVYRIEYLLTGSFSRVPMIILSTLSLNLSILLTVMTSRKLFGNRKAVFTLILCALFSPFFTYTPYFYTDSLSIPFATGCVFTFVSAVQCDGKKKKAVLFPLSGALCCIGFLIKGSVAILLPAALIWLLLRNGLKNAAKQGIALILGFAVLFGAYSAVIKSINLIPEEMSRRYQFPLTHWAMVGTNDLGAFSPEDRKYTLAYPSKEEKVQANLDKIGERLSEKGFFGTVLHLGIKAVWTWQDGTYYIANYLENYYRYTPLHSLILYDGDLRLFYYAICCGFQLFLLLMMAYGGIAARKSREIAITTFLRIAVIGLALFLLIWETNARYLFNFTPLFLLLATESIDGFSRKVSSLIRKRKVSRQPIQTDNLYFTAKSAFENESAFIFSLFLRNKFLPNC